MNWSFLVSRRELKASALYAVFVAVPLCAGLFVALFSGHGGQGLGAWVNVVMFFFAPLLLIRLVPELPYDFIMVLGFVLSALWLVVLVHGFRFVVMRKYRRPAAGAGAALPPASAIDKPVKPAPP